MIANKREFSIGLGLMIGFVMVFIAIFMPLFGGKNGLNYLDDLYNSISKGSANYIPGLVLDSEKHEGETISVSLTLGSEKQAEETMPLFLQGGAVVQLSGAQLSVQGDLGRILANCLADCADMFANDGQKVAGKYGYPERNVLFNWWKALQALEKQLAHQKAFSESRFVASVNTRAVECSYNYYKITPEKISNKAGTVVLSLAFYVLYTLWYGFAFMYLFQGLGFRLEH